MTAVKRILLECTNTYHTSLNTGIQRTARNIVKKSKEIGAELGVKCQPVIAKYGRLVKINHELKEGSRFRAKVTAWARLAYGRIRQVCRALPVVNGMGKYLKPPTRRLVIWLAKYSVVEIVLFPLAIIVHYLQRVQVKKGDLLLMLDSSWVDPVWPTIRKAKDAGAVIGLVVYDIIPISHPAFVAGPTRQRFQNWFAEAMAHVDFFVAISQAVRDEIEDYARVSFAEAYRPDRFASFKLGSVIDVAANRGNVRKQLRGIFDNGNGENTYLSVGTIEPRKNYGCLVSAFDQVWKSKPEARLCIVGRIGWSSAEFLNSARRHRQYNKRLLIFDDLSDAELKLCYRQAKALIFPSLAEGFGLPLVEALHYGLPVLASDIPVFREIGQDSCAYFNPRQPESLANMILNLESQPRPALVPKPQTCQLADWKDSCRELLSKAIVLSGQARVSFPSGLVQPKVMVKSSILPKVGG